MPTLILFNGKLPGTPFASAVAIAGNTITARGDDPTITALARPHTRLIDLERRLLLPGLTDAHFHFYTWIQGRAGLPLSGVKSMDDLLARLKIRADETSANTWITGTGWNESEWASPLIPSRLHLDAISTRHPIILWRSDLHLAVANSYALYLAGITAARPDPADGVIERDAAGNPTGVLKELAINLVSQHISPLAGEPLYREMIAGITQLHQLGITGLHDQRLMDGLDTFPALTAYQELRRRDQLLLRLCTNIHYNQLPQAIDLGLQSGFGDDFLRLGFVKLFADGSMGAHTAWMLDPYEDGGLGMCAMPLETIAGVLDKASRHGWAVSIHAIGSRANREILDLFEEKSTTLPPPPVPHRIEHAQLLHPAELPRFARLQLTASVQPLHLADDRVLADRVWGNRARYAYAFQSLRRHGTRLVLGSDCPVADPNPWWGIHAAVNRRKPTDTITTSWYPEECLTVAEAVEGYTLASATAIGQQNRLGSIAPGKLADLIVVDRDIFTVDPLLLADTRVLLTVFNGGVVFDGR